MAKVPGMHHVTCPLGDFGSRTAFQNKKTGEGEISTHRKDKLTRMYIIYLWHVLLYKMLPPLRRHDRPVKSGHAGMFGDACTSFAAEDMNLHGIEDIPYLASRG